MLDQMKPMFTKGGPLERLYPLYEAQETFLLTSGHVTHTGAHVRDALDSKRFMVTVIIALLPCVFMGAWNAGYQSLLSADTPSPGFQESCLAGLWIIMPIILTSYVAGGLCEALFAVVRKHEINEGFLVTGLLFPLTCPPTIPLWMVAIGIIFGVVIGKEVFGGTGMNIFNPALTARAFVFFSYATQMSGDRVWAAVDYKTKIADGISGATPLNAVGLAEAGAKASEVLTNYQQSHALMHYDWWTCFLGFIPGSIGETSTLACLIGAAILIATGIGSWRTMAGVLIGGSVMALILNTLATPTRGALLSIPFYWHWVIGSYAFAAVFMATDPVSSAVTKTGKWIYGLMIGVLAVLIRVVNPAYPEGFMLAILFMNAFAPTIDHLVVQSNIQARQRRMAHAA